MSNIFIVHAHPEPKSFTSALKDLAVATLEAAGHSVQVSDLYAMRFKACADVGDFLDPADPTRLRYVLESKHGFETRTQTADVAAEQEKLRWADAVLLSFPLWWFGMPAILKGWIDRVFAYGFAYGVGQHGGERWGDRYGEGTLAGRRAMLTVSIGGREPHYGDRGVNGRLDDLLWPVQHGVLFYPGMDVVPPFCVYQTDHLSESAWPALADRYRNHLAGLFTTEPIQFRSQNGGHYDGQQVLKPGLGKGEAAARLHLVQPGEPSETAGPRAATETSAAGRMPR